MNYGRTLARVIKGGVRAVRILKWTMGMAVMAVCVVPAMAQQSIQTAFNYNLADEEVAAEEPAAEASSSGCACEEPSCGCDSGCCDNGCDGGNCLGDCCLGDAWTLSSCLTPCCDEGPTYGGWMSWGYYNKNERLSTADGDGLSFN